MDKKNSREEDKDQNHQAQVVHQEVLHHLLNLLVLEENEKIKKTKNKPTNKKIRITKLEDPSKKDLNNDDLKKKDQKIEDQSLKIRRKVIDMTETIVMVKLQDTTQEIHEKVQSQSNPNIHQSMSFHAAKQSFHAAKHTIKTKTDTEANKVKGAEVVNKTAIVVTDDMIM